MAKITISVPDEVVEALAGGDKAVLAAKLKELAVNTVALKTRLQTKIADLVHQASLVAFFAEQLAKCKVEEVPSLALATIKSTRTLLEMAKDAATSEGYMKMIKVLEAELERLEDTTERIRSGKVEEEVRREIESILSREVGVMVSRALRQVRETLRETRGVELRSEDMEEIKSKVVAVLMKKLEEMEAPQTLIKAGVALRKQDLRLTTLFLASQALSLVMILADSLHQVIKLSDPLAKMLNEIASKLEESASLLKSSRGDSDLALEALYKSYRTRGGESKGEGKGGEG